MFRFALIFFVIAIVLLVLGVGGVAASWLMYAAGALFVVGVVLLLLHVLGGTTPVDPTL